MELPFKNASTIGHFAKNLESWRGGGWLFIPAGADLSLATPCYQQDWDPRDLSPEEQDQLDDQIKADGFRPFFEWGQLSMIVENLRLQKQDYSDADLVRAIQHYWKHDAYIVI